MQVVDGVIRLEVGTRRLTDESDVSLLCSQASDITSFSRTNQQADVPPLMGPTVADVVAVIESVLDRKREVGPLMEQPAAVGAELKSVCESHSTMLQWLETMCDTLPLVERAVSAQQELARSQSEYESILSAAAELAKESPDIARALSLRYPAGIEWKALPQTRALRDEIIRDAKLYSQSIAEKRERLNSIVGSDDFRSCLANLRELFPLAEDSLFQEASSEVLLRALEGMRGQLTKELEASSKRIFDIVDIGLTHDAAVAAIERWQTQGSETPSTRIASISSLPPEILAQALEQVLGDANRFPRRGSQESSGEVVAIASTTA